jgi:hypothetical protein
MLERSYRKPILITGGFVSLLGVCLMAWGAILAYSTTVFVSGFALALGAFAGCAYWIFGFDRNAKLNRASGRA